MTGFPSLRVEISFSAGASTANLLHLDDTSRGKLNTNTLADTNAFADVTEFVRHVKTQRGSSRVQGPITRYESGTATIVLNNNDRRFDPTNLSGPYVSGGRTEVEPMRIVRIQATWNDVVYDLFRGYADDWSLTFNKARSRSDVVLTATDGFKVLSGHRRQAQLFEGAGEDAGTRVVRILDSIAWNESDRVVAVGDTTLQATNLEGDPLAELLLVADSEFGELYIDAAGRLVFRNRSATFEDSRSRESQAMFGDDVATELPYADLSVDYDDTQMVNEAKITREGGVTQVASDATSMTRYLPHSFERSGLLMDTDEAALEYAGRLVYHNKDPELRFAELTVKPLRDPDHLFPHALGREIGDRITVAVDPPGEGDRISRDVFVRGVSHDITPDTWKTTWALQSASTFDGFILDSATHGVLGEDVLAF